MAINDLLKLNAETNRGQSNDTQTNSFFGLGENEVEQILEPNLELSINALMDFGWTTEEIVEDFGSQNSPEIFSMATAAVTFYEDFDVYELNGEYIFTPKPHALNGDNDNYNKLRVCFLEATGIGLAMGALGIGSGELLSGLAKKKAIKKAIKKVVSRTLGWVGAAWAVYDFGYCMDWW